MQFYPEKTDKGCQFQFVPENGSELADCGKPAYAWCTIDKQKTYLCLSCLDYVRTMTNGTIKNPEKMYNDVFERLNNGLDEALEYTDGEMSV